jgi:demethylmenaquinone methyltransferase/2-methoxy-6-polyprenyl-1,4-benzoquinol methylase
VPGFHTSDPDAEEEPVTTDLADYYERRAPHYDAVYAKPERQADLLLLQQQIPSLLTGRHVLEVAAGTGYWTQCIAATAQSIRATDYNAGPLAIAAGRDYPRGNVEFEHADAYALDQLSGEYDAAFVGFWWSHMLLADTDRFLDGLCARLTPGSPLVIIDNQYVEGSNHAITRTDQDGNTYQRRSLPDGSAHEVLKNFPTAAKLLDVGRRHGTGPELTEFEYYWLLTFSAGASSR